MRALAVLIALLFLPVAVPAKGDPWKALSIERIDSLNAPDFSLEDLDGNSVTLSGFDGKVVFLNFWATWCPPCKEEMPSMEALYNRFKDEGLAVVAVTSYEGRKKVAKFIKSNAYTFTVLLDSSGMVSREYKAVFIPTTFLIDKNGMVVGKVTGSRNWGSDSAYNLIEELLDR